jgi:UDP-2-acetamido-2,6-beta-L-arabino-hexul-4-ose reductase
MQVLITGARGFIGRNLALRLTEAGHAVLPITRKTTDAELADMVARADAVVHLAGANRPDTDDEFSLVNDQFTAHFCGLLRARMSPVPLIAASTIQIDRDTPYGRSKRTGEEHLRAFAKDSGAPVNICRLVNVFGKWCRPNYNSVVATFCHNIARDLPITINDPSAEVRLVHVDDVIDAWIGWLRAPGQGAQVTTVEPEYKITLHDLAKRLRAFRAIRETHTVGKTGTGLGRALYATYVSYLPVADFAYLVTRHGDQRGVFSEMLRTEHSGQFSFFTAGPGVTRGGHYHHVKTEKFLVLKGRARFRFLNMDTGETHSIDTTGDQSLIVETVPGWSHDITNTGTDELICMLWANELFDRERPDTVSHQMTS